MNKKEIVNSVNIILQSSVSQTKITYLAAKIANIQQGKTFCWIIGTFSLEKLLLFLLKKYCTKLCAKHICSKYLISGATCNAIIIRSVKWRKKLRTESTVCNQKYVSKNAEKPITSR